MTSALAYKECREVQGIAASGLAAFLIVAVANMGWSPLPGLLGSFRQGQIPFLSDPFVMQFGLAACALAMALGLKQSLGDFAGDGQLFLLHRPVTRGRIYGTKLVVGMAIYLLLAALPVTLYTAWASMPGTHASPFVWSMTVPAWTVCLAMTAVYLGAFLAGLRPAAWFGTRLAPLAAAAGSAFVLALLPAAIAWPALIVGDALLAALVLHVAATRDFS